MKAKSKHQADKAIRWLLDGDPAIRWQTLRDLIDGGELSIERERSKISREGWGGRLLAKQDQEGTWAGGQSADGGLYSPKWTSTTYTMLLLRDFGLPSTNRQARRACALLLEGGLQRDGGSDPAHACRAIARSEGGSRTDYNQLASPTSDEGGSAMAGFAAGMVRRYLVSFGLASVMITSLGGVNNAGSKARSVW